MEEILQKILNLDNALDLRNRLFKKYKKRCYGVMDWVLLSRESKIKVIGEIKNNSIREGAQIFPSCFVNKSYEFYIARIDALITYVDREKIKLKVIEEGIVVMIICIGLTEEIKSLSHADRESVLPLLKERLRKEERFGIPFKKCFEEIFNINEK